MRYDPMPFPEGKYLTTKSGYAIHYHEAGERQPGKPSILFLHGSGPGASGYSNFKQNYPVFAAAGYRPISIDLSELIKGGGSIKCCTQEIRPAWRTK